MLEQQCNDLFSGTVESQMWKGAHMICFRLTPLWKIKETEQWLNDLLLLFRPPFLYDNNIQKYTAKEGGNA